MPSIRKRHHGDEINLLDLFIIIGKNKWKIISIIVVVMIATFIYSINRPHTKILYEVTTEIRPVSTFDEFEYESFNSYLKKYYLVNPNLYFVDIKEADKTYIYSGTNDLSIYNINKLILLKLFIDKINENSFFINAIKNYKFIKREDYETSAEYEVAIKKLASEITLTRVKNDQGELNWNIKFRTNDKDTWKKFLIYIEQSANSDVRKYLIEKFDQFITNEQRLNSYEIEDIDLIISNTIDNNELDELKKKKNILLKDRRLQRIKYLFEKTPIIKSEKLYAAKLMIGSSNSKILGRKIYGIAEMLIISSLIAGIFAILFILILNSIKNRK